MSTSGLYMQLAYTLTCTNTTYAHVQHTCTMQRTCMCSHIHYTYMHTYNTCMHAHIRYTHVHRYNTHMHTTPHKHTQRKEFSSLEASPFLPALSFKPALILLLLPCLHTTPQIRSFPLVY